MNFFKYIIFAVLLVSGTNEIWAQDLIFSQYQISPANLNPAVVGNSFGARFGLHYRNQWPSVPNAYISYLASYDQYIPEANVGVGVHVLNDVLGDGIYQNTHVGLTGNYAVSLSDDFGIRGGLQAKWVNSKLDYSKLRFFDQIDPELGFRNEFGATPLSGESEEGDNINYVAVSLGGALIYKDWVLGFSALNLNEPDESRFRESNTPIPKLISLQLGGVVELNERAKLLPSLLFVNQNEFAQVQLSSAVEIDGISGSLGYRHTISNADAFILSASYKKEIFKVIYSYDITLSGLAGSTGGAHEVGIVIDFAESPRLKARQKSKSYNNCLKIFK